MKSCLAAGERTSLRGPSGEDIRVHRLAAVHAVDRRLRDVIEGLGCVGDALASIELVDRLPGIEARTNGFAGSGLLRGHFRVRGLGEGKLFLDVGEAPWILVRLRAGFVILGLDTSARTRALYDEMAARWPEKVVAPSR